MTPREKLLQAATLLDEVRSELNVNSETCASCGLNKKENWSEAQLAENLHTASKKIQRYAAMVR
jgi:hypothetical protein